MFKKSEIPNILTIYRVFSIPLIIICIVPQSFLFNWLALILYIVTCFTDFLDGYLARKFKVESKFGKFLDPVADKVLIVSIIFILVAVGRIEGFLIYPSLIIIIRELLVSGLREFFSNNKPHINVTILAKWKTLLQMISLGFIIIGDDFFYFSPYIYPIGSFGIFVASILTIYTGYKYFEENLKTLK